jgi:hypothetical protein
VVLGLGRAGGAAKVLPVAHLRNVGPTQLANGAGMEIFFALFKKKFGFRETKHRSNIIKHFFYFIIVCKISHL